MKIEYLRHSGDLAGPGCRHDIVGSRSMDCCEIGEIKRVISDARAAGATHLKIDGDAFAIPLDDCRTAARTLLCHGTGMTWPESYEVLRAGGR